MKIKERVIIDRMFEEGIASGVRYAFKHQEHPSPKDLESCLYDSLWNAFYEYFDLEEE